MVEMLEAVTSWQSLLMVLLVFGVAPGLVLRLIVRIYPKDDPRRRELVAELYVQNRFERPLWVAEQFETALTEGAGQRLRDIRDRRRARKEEEKALEDAYEELAREDPETARVIKASRVRVASYRRPNGVVVMSPTRSRRMRWIVRR